MANSQAGIPIVDYTDSNGRVYKLRGIRARDTFALAESLADWPQLDTPYRLNHAMRDVENWSRENAAFSGLPAADFMSLCWALDCDGAAVGFCRIVYLGTQSHIHFQVIHPDYRGDGHFTVMNYMLRTLIEPMGVKTVTFDSLAQSPAVMTHATDKLGLAPVESTQGMTGQQVASFQFTSDYQAERLKDPKNSRELINASLVVPVPASADPVATDAPATPPPDRNPPQTPPSA